MTEGTVPVRGSVVIFLSRWVQQDRIIWLDVAYWYEEKWRGFQIMASFVNEYCIGVGRSVSINTLRKHRVHKYKRIP